MDVSSATDPFSPARLGPVALRNRVIKAATFEGMTAKHVVSDPLIEFHRHWYGSDPMTKSVANGL